MRPRSLVAAVLALAGVAGPAGATKPEPPLTVAVSVLSAHPDRGRYTLAIRLRSDVALDDASLTIRVHALAAPGPASARETPRLPFSESLALPRGREVRREVEVLTRPHEPVTVLVGLGGASAGVRLHRTGSVDLGPPRPDDAGGRTRTDQYGRTYFEVPVQPRAEERR